MIREKVVVLTLLCDRNAAILPVVVRNWNQIDFGDRDVTYLAVANDAGDETIQAFSALAQEGGRNLAVVKNETIDERVPDLEHARDPRGSMRHFNIIHLHRMALLREEARTAALMLHLQRGSGGMRPPTYGRPYSLFFWLDADTGVPEDAFLRLLAALRDNAGPQRPRSVTGLYNTRHEGATIGHALPPDSRHGRHVSGAGYGCRLNEREVTQLLSFAAYGRFRADLRWQREMGMEQGIFGEDFFWDRCLFDWCGVQPWEDSGVRCRHYHSDGTYWTYEEQRDTPCLRSVYHEETRLPGTGCMVRNKGGGRVYYEPYGLELLPGAEPRCVSPEVRDKLFEMWPGQIEETAPALVEWLGARTRNVIYPTFESIASAVGGRYGPRDGWCHPEEARALYELCKEVIPIGGVIEIGVNRGLSTCFEAAGGNRVFAFDPYDPEKWQATKEWPQHPEDEKAYDFAGRQWHALGLHNIVLQRKASPAALGYLQSDAVPLGLVFIDGEHTYNACKADLEAWSPLIAPGGYLCLHDYVNIDDAHSDGVPQAAAEALSPQEWEGPRIVHSMAVYRRRLLN